ncbi:LysR family transcriptional regulator [bacterium M00.F.Ca.ET.228.01.1.1]|uniref:LysR family transcriptional regulator n=2 Tax=Pseudomonadota TaxID=1224 RepID=UPI0010930521|nr:LysR family transcriptional regulator [Paraburkholderia phenoliruptrix]TGP41479.1 LysR family transcriptional regulator [bacterium M00.F.Ca.ET.228.01.1.1]TGR98136.1 LysR family transcriptional regulator [bacterium M00.F.Ca.ET.191.01.1.1]TGU02327.1 LysR family transcriptional regulator [bacterium M00.F.Ca.ET.155.01.1.1]MBW0447125.1 LysR family transcriptional regulator [Paraburkholderia phenoliruptrix]MBW9101492.1 LysR family transcriptional regulator [Paraburkholderia phenoliruptrix]
MLDGVSMDQLRTFIAAADEGSFSAAGRRLRRAQSVVSQTLANLEGQINVQLFDRSSRYPRLTEQGTALLAQARLVVSGMDGFKSKARAISEGLEPELSVVVDVMYPMASLTAAVGEFRNAFPHTPLRLYVEALGAVVRPVLDRECRLGISGSMPAVPETVDTEKLLDVPMVTVAAPAHPLASIRRVIRQRELEEHVQLVLTDRTTLTEGKTFGVLSPLIWRLADLGAKHAFLRAGFGWGHMPAAIVHDHIVSGELVPLQIENFQPQTPPIAMFAIYRKDTPPGPAGRWFLDRLRQPSEAPAR